MQYALSISHRHHWATVTGWIMSIYISAHVTKSHALANHYGNKQYRRRKPSTMYVLVHCTLVCAALKTVKAGSAALAIYGAAKQGPPAYQSHWTVHTKLRSDQPTLNPYQCTGLQIHWFPQITREETGRSPRNFAYTTFSKFRVQPENGDPPSLGLWSGTPL